MNQIFNIDPPAAALSPVDAAREANHRIANNLSLLIATLHVQARSVAGGPADYAAEEVADMLNEIAARMRAVTSLHRTLARGADGENIDLADHLQNICGMLVDAFGGEGRAFVTCDVSPVAVPARTAVAIGLVVTELVTNAIKYAHPTGITGEIAVRCRGEASALTIEVADDGIGLPEGFDPQMASSVGFELVRTLARSLTATVQYLDEGLGLRVVLSIPA